MICLMPKPSQSFFVHRIQSKEKDFLQKKSLTWGQIIVCPLLHLEEKYYRNEYENIEEFQEV